MRLPALFLSRTAVPRVLCDYSAISVFERLGLPQYRKRSGGRFCQVEHARRQNAEI